MGLFLFVECGERLEHFFRALHIVLRPVAEHRSIAPGGEIAVREAAAGEYRAQRVLLVRFSVESRAAGRDNGGHILGALHAPFNFECRHAGFRHLFRVAQERHILEREHMIACAAMPVEAARLRTEAAVPAAAAEHS
jgi:hypothetical protein